MFPNKAVDVKIQVTGDMLRLNPVSSRAYTWCRKEFGVDAPRGPDGEWALRPDKLDELLASLPEGYVVFRGM
jgi:hypothetical protein